MKKLIIFDFHGVILRGSMKELAYWAAKVQKKTFKEMYDIIYWKWFSRASEGKISEKEFFEKAAKEVGMPGKGAKLRQVHVAAQKLNRSVTKYAEDIQKRGHTVLLLSKNTPPQFKEYIRKFGLQRKFPNIINTFDLKLPKASKETVNYLLKRFGVKAKDCYFIDDQAQNLVVPKKFGMHVHLYKNFPGLRAWFTKNLKR